MQMFAYLLTTGVTTGALYALIAIGLVVVYKSAGVINFAHGEQLMLGGFFAYSLHVLAGVAYIPALLIAVAGALGLGILTYWAGFRPVMKHGLVSVLLATIGLSYIMKGLARHFWGGKGDYLSFPPIISPEPVSIAGVMVLSQQLIVVGASLVVMVAFAAFFRATRAGKWMQATANNPKAAKLVGIPIHRVYQYTFAVGATVAGTAAVLMAPLTLLYPDMGFVLFVKGFAAAVLGGLTSVRGAILGGFLVGIIEQMGGGYIHTSLQDVSAFVVIMVMLIFMPTGLLGARDVRRI